MIKKYYPNKPITIIKWDGTDETLEIIKKEVETKATFGYRNYVQRIKKYSTVDSKILAITVKDSGFLTKLTVYVNDNIVIDPYDKLCRISKCNDAFIKQNYIETAIIQPES